MNLAAQVQEWRTVPSPLTIQVTALKEVVDEAGNKKTTTDYVLKYEALAYGIIEGELFYMATNGRTFNVTYGAVSNNGLRTITVFKAES